MVSLLGDVKLAWGEIVLRVAPRFALEIDGGINPPLQ